ncbi:uncharacterized protein [Zea mays]|uniref:uncharacterized protein n=1 Tax=Zea mays TaxID=4577 RepID=UPI001652697F|nr:uncharacterized protein LOC118472029 [Zea mays]
MADLLGDPVWPQLHPRPYTDTPWPGLQCELAPDDARVLRATRLHLGPDVATSPCRPRARLDPALLGGLPHLQTLSIFGATRAVHVVVLARADRAQVQPRPHRPHTGDVGSYFGKYCVIHTDGYQLSDKYCVI